MNDSKINKNSAIAKFIKSARAKMKINQATFGEKFSCTKGNVSAWELGRHEPAYSTLLKISEQSGVRMPNTIIIDHQRINQPEATYEPALNLPPFKAVPIVGTVQGGDNGYLSNLDYPPGYGDDSIYFPTKNHDTYALRVRGDSMSPRIKDGEHVIIDPHPEISPGDEVIVCLKNEKKMVKQFLFKKEGRYTFGSINEDHKNITESEENIESIDRVIAIITK